MANDGDRIVPAGIKPRFELMPPGILQFKIEKPQEGYIGKEGEEVYGIVVPTVLTAPEEVVGMTKDVSFFIGVTEKDTRVQKGKLQPDPDANNPETWQARASDLKELCDAVGVQLEEQAISVVLSELDGREFLGRVQHAKTKEYRQDGTPHPNAGMVNANIKKFLAVGAAEVMVDHDAALTNEPAPAAGAGRPTTAPGSRPGPRAAGPAMRPTPQPAAASAAPARPAPARPAPVARISR